MSAEAPGSEAVGKGWLRLHLGIWLACLGVLLLTVNGRLFSTDAELMYQMTESVAVRGSAAVKPHEYASLGRDGRYYSKYGPVQSILAVPLYLVGRVAATRVSEERGEQLRRAAVSLFNPIVLALLVCAVIWAAGGFGFTTGESVAAGLMAAFGAGLWWLSKTFNSEPLTGLFLVLAFGALVRQQTEARVRFAVLGGIALGLAVGTRVAVVLTVPVLLAYVWFSSGRKLRTVLAFVAPLAVTAILLAAYNFARFGSPLKSGYGSEAFDYPVWRGTLGLLVSPRCGMLFSAPLLLMAIPGGMRMAGRWRREMLAIGAMSLIWLLSSGAWWCWWGGWSVGPRLFLPMAPLLVIPVVYLMAAWHRKGGAARTALLAVVAGNLLLQTIPLWSSHPEYKAIAKSAEAEGRDEMWDPHYLLVAWQVRNAAYVIGSTLDGSWRDPAKAGFGGDESGSVFDVPVIDAWPFYLIAAGLSPIIALAASAVPIGMALVGAGIARRAYRSLDGSSARGVPA